MFMYIQQEQSHIFCCFEGNFGQMPVSGQQMGGFQPSQSYGGQGFAPQQGQVKV